MEYPTRTEAQVEFLHNGADHVRQHSKAYQQLHWFSGEGSSKAQKLWQETLENPECGTTACLAGHLALGNKMGYFEVFNEFSGSFMTHEVEKKAGLNYQEANIFSGNAEDWPEPYKARWFEARENERPDEMAKAGADMLDDIADGLVWFDYDVSRWVTIEEWVESKEKKEGPHDGLRRDVGEDEDDD